LLRQDEWKADEPPGNCSAAARLGIKMILFQSKANKDLNNGYINVANWKAAVDEIECYLEGASWEK